MHLHNQDRPYHSTTDALSFWLELPTCVAVKIDNTGRIIVTAPHGLDDLIQLRVAPTVRGIEKINDYQKRINCKNWQCIWPMLVIIDCI